MADKVKGAVFSMLVNILDRLDRDWGRVLDLYSGSGSIGIEALSRGAVWADFVEINASVCRIIGENLEHTKMQTKARVNNRNVHAFLSSPPPPPGPAHAKRQASGLQHKKGGSYRKRHEGAFLDVAVQEAPVEPVPPPETIHNEKQYDIIFLDPPYADPKIPDTLLHVTRSGLAKLGGLVVIGHSPRVVLQPSYGEFSETSVQINLLKFRRHGDCAFTIFMVGNPADYGFGAENAVETELEDSSAEIIADDDDWVGTEPEQGSSDLEDDDEGDR